MNRLRNLPGSLRSRSRNVRAHLQRHGVRAMVAALAMTCTTTAIASGHDSVASKAGSTVRHWLEVGQASWYGLKFQGRRTANGEKFDQNGLTCAHRTLPLGSWLRVTNLHNQRSVLVRVTDRGPMDADRVVDLSMAAAKAVGLNGTGKVKLEAVDPHDPGTAQALLAQLQLPPLTTITPLNWCYAKCS